MSVPARYDRVSRLLHWLSAPLVLVLLVVGWLMVDIPLGIMRFDTVNLHKSLGVLLLLFTLMRLLHQLAEQRAVSVTGRTYQCSVMAPLLAER